MNKSSHPILFSSNMVRAYMDGRKTQTRRVINPQPEYVWGYGVRIDDPDYFSVHVRYPGGHQPDPWIHCPYGKPGHTLWVRETWAVVNTLDHLKPSEIQYGDFSWPQVWYKATDDHSADYRKDFFGKWRSPIFMPRWASRFELPILSIRPERLQDISEEDAKSEGVANLPYRYAYCMLWNEINAKRGYPWDTNPRVWRIEFPPYME
jgi:hypothetical protein